MRDYMDGKYDSIFQFQANIFNLISITLTVSISSYSTRIDVIWSLKAFDGTHVDIFNLRYNTVDPQQ